MVKLFCALVGEKETFSIDIDASKYVGDLKDTIALKQKYEFAAHKLQLFLARKSDGTWLDTYDAEALKLDENRHLEGFMQMDPLLWIKNTMNFGERFEPNDGEIHVLVVVPENAASDITAATTPFAAEQLKMVINEVLDQRDQKDSEYSISTCSQSKEMLFMQQLGVKYASIPIHEVIDNSIHGYQWSELTEKHPDQRKAYIKYLEEHLREALISGQEQKDFLMDTSGMYNLLDCDDPHRLPFRLKGTTGLMIIDNLANRMNDAFVGLRFVIEVKKNRPSNKEQWQLLLELVVADFKCEERCAPMGLLTNLNDYWYFLWITQDKKIARMVLTCPANGFKTMKQVLEDRSGPTFDGDFPMRLSFLDSPIPLKRQKLLQGASGCDDAASEMLE